MRSGGWVLPCGIELVDTDVFSVPLLHTDPYGKFTRGPNGYPQIVTTTGGLVEGNPAAPITTANAVKSGGAFLDDISHFAVPGPTDHDRNPGTPKVPAVADTNQGTTDDGDAATYDDEMLGAHFMAGDGRVNENIGLTAVHHVFHSEHNRLVDEADTDDPSDIKTVIKDYAATGATDLFTLADWQRADGQWDGERLFQAAKFITEMEYQHLAFEEFARKVQPLINLFGEGGTGYITSINPSVRGEFANAVYRFGHSMLTETVPQVSAGTNPSRTDMPLLKAFLNPPAFMTGTQTPDQAAGNIARGTTRQVGAEIDEFVTDALRNELLGLPLDLPALNIARARETGTPTLNAARRAFFATSNNSALAPYESWADFQFAIRNPGSLVNFMAAYGTHDSITDTQTMAGKRNAANALLYGAAGPDGVELDDSGTAVNEAADNPTGTMPTDSFEFLNSTGAYANGAGGVTTTGVDDIDLWMGGLAERQIVFGGLLGPTFNYVFEKQMEDLQNGDRFYYLSRTVSQNLLVQLEGNSFAEMIQRNTDVSGLPADSFSRPDLVFDMAAQNASGPIVDDPDTTYNETQLLTRMADGTIRYGKVPGAHTVFNGTAGNDRMWSGEGDDTIRGNDGNDRIQGGDGVDSLIGGLGDDVIQDLAGDDTLKGGDGNDVLSSGQGFGGDLNQGGRGNDFILGGNDITELFAGLGDDYVYGGDADDTVFGDEGNDWIEGGTGNFNLLQGDNGAPFQDDALGGHDILIGYGGEQDYDAEGGDDVMLGGPGIQRAEGMLGFDWFTHDQDPSPTPADSDMAITGLLPPSVETNKDRFDLVESLSGWDKNDTLRGDNRVAADMAGHGLNTAGIARTAGLAGLLPTGATSFSGGNIIIGGAGSDLIEGRGGNDIIDGDAYLNVRISVRSATDPNAELKTVDTMAGVQAEVLAGTINPGQLRMVREILTPANGTAVDTAVFSGASSEYTITGSGASVTVAHTGGTGLDGTDTVRNAELLQFTDRTVSTTPPAATAPAAPTAVTAVAGDASATVSWTAPASNGGSPITGYEVDVLVGTTVVRTVAPTGTATSTVVTGLTNGTAHTFQVRAVNAVGTGATSVASAAVTPTATAPVARPGAPTIGTAVAGNTQATVNWTAPTTGGATASYAVLVRTGTTTVRTITGIPATATSTVVTGLTNGTAYNFRVRAVNSVGFSVSASSNVVTPAGTVTVTAPGAPTIGTATAGNAAATVNWTAPANTGGAAISEYRIDVRTGTTVVRTVSGVAGTASSSVVTGLTNGTAYTFQVRAVNSAGPGALSASSNAVTPTGTVTATRPGTPVIGTAVSGVAGGTITATANWAAPTSDGGSAITGYRVFALRMNADGTVAATTTSAVQPATARSLSMTVPVAGNYRFQVNAINAIGTSNRSAQSNTVAAR